MMDVEQPARGPDQEVPARPPGRSIMGTEEHCRQVLAITGLGTLRICLRRGLVRLDPAAARQLGIETYDEQVLSLAHWLSLFSEGDRLRLRSVVHSHTSPGSVNSLKADLTLSANGTPTTLELTFSADVGTGQLVGACRDVNVAQNLEEAHRQRMTAERENQAKSEFMSQVSHEMRTPLNAILGFAQLMAMDTELPLTGKQQERLRVLHQSGLRLLALVDQLLQIGKIEQGKMPLRIRPVNVFALARRCADALSPMAAERDVAIEINVANQDVASVRADPNALEQVLTNLLSNGIKYNRMGGRVVLGFGSAEAGEITVHDTGPGLTSSQIAHLFEPFNRLNAERSRVQGTGLGLVISRRLVELMDGMLDVRSEPGMGSRFRVTLPLARSTRDKSESALPVEMPAQWHTDEPFNVLYIEDDEVNIVLMEQLFATQPDWRLCCARTGEEGLVEAVQQDPHVILLDLHLPDMAGREVLKRLKCDSRTRDVPVVAVSADANVRNSRATGFEDYWVKPLDLAATISKLKRLFAEHGKCVHSL
jgi:signal transduction histidine kinase/ActR/RegA family two-component response regulator